ncbi:MAG: CsgG/HfaB family protein [Spirochaetota bacterium]
MKRIFAIVLTAITAAATLPAKDTVLLLRFFNGTEYSGIWNISSGLTSMFNEELTVSGKFNVIEKNLFSLYGTDTKKLDDAGKLAEMGKSVGARYVIHGVINEFAVRGTGLISPGIGGGVYYNSIVRCTIKTLRVADNQLKILEAKGFIHSVDVGLTILGGPSESENIDAGSLMSRLEKARFGSDAYKRTIIGQATVTCVTDFAAQFNRIFPVEVTPVDARIMLVDGSSMYVNVGFDANIRAGYRFAVYRRGEAILDDRTKAVLGYRDIDVGEIEIVEVKAASFSRAKVITQIKPFQKGDSLRIIRKNIDEEKKTE